MDSFYWLVIGVLMVAGLVGTVLPLVPGHVLVLVGAVIHHFAFGARGVGWGTLLVLTVLLLAGLAVECLSGAVGAKYFGATRWGALGGIVGAIGGLFFGFVGLLVGPLLGVLLGEMLGGKGILPAGKSVWGSFLGGLAGGVIKFSLAAAMIAVFAVAAFWH